MKNILEKYYYNVSTFGSATIGPLTERQTNNRDHFVRTMEFLGLSDVDVDALSKAQRAEIAALAAQRRKELAPFNKKNASAARPSQSDVYERKSVPNKRQWDIRRGINIKLYKALDALELDIQDVEVLTDEQRGILYTELKRREMVKKFPDMKSSHPSEGYEKLEKIYTKPEPFVDVSSLLKLIAKTPRQTKPQAKAKTRPTRPKYEPVGVLPELQELPETKPKNKEPRKSTALCPKPYKKTYATRELALQFIDKTFPNDKKIAPYLCQCGAIHIGH